MLDIDINLRFMEYFLQICLKNTCYFKLCKGIFMSINRYYQRLFYECILLIVPSFMVDEYCVACVITECNPDVLVSKHSIAVY